MKLKIKAKAILGAAAVMIGMFAPMFSANAENPLIDALEKGETCKKIISLAHENPDLVGTSEIWCAIIQWGEKTKSDKSSLEKELLEIYYSHKYPLHVAVERGDKGAIKRLLEENSTLISTGLDCYSRLPIQYVNDLETLKCLYEHGGTGFKIAVAADPVFNSLFYRCSFEPSLLEFLLQHAGDEIINWRDRYGNTILHSLFNNLSIYNNVCSEKEKLSKCMDSIELVMQHGGEKIINTLTKSGRTPLDLLRYNSENLVSVFQDKYGAKYSSELS